MTTSTMLICHARSMRAHWIYQKMWIFRRRSLPYGPRNSIVQDRQWLMIQQGKYTVLADVYTKPNDDGEKEKITCLTAEVVFSRK